MATSETGKQRASRIPLDYFRKRDPLSRTKLALTLIVLGLTLVWVVSGLLRRDAGNSRYSRGPVAAVHAAWDSECNACHAPFSPLSAENWLFSVGGNPHAGDARCQSCHAGPDHHANQKLEHTPSCAACHRDHRGREASLVRTPDTQCLVCHADDLKNHLKPDAKLTEEFQAVRRFDAGGHPEFKLIRDKTPDPGRIKFNHKLHLTLGQVAEPGGQPWTLAHIADATERARYAARQEDQSANAPVKLECASCHQLDGGGFGFNKPQEQLNGLPLAGVLPARSPGARFLPITYENQCKACHPLTIDVQAGKDAPPKLTAVPHRLQPNELHRLLVDTYTAEFVRESPDKLLERPFFPKRPLPSKLLNEAEEKKAQQYVLEKVARAEDNLLRGKKTCYECHYYQPALDQVQRDKQGYLDWSRVRMEPSAIPDVWFTHAKFSHVAHRAMDCKECHAQAEASTSHRDVLLPDVANCQQCHAPPSRSGQAARGGVRFDCAECHTYHNGDHPRQGLGAGSRNPGRRLSTQEFLSGGASR